MSARTIEQLREVITRTSSQLLQDLDRKNIKAPTLNSCDAGPTLEDINSSAARELADAAREMHSLAIGPSKMLNLTGLIYHDVSSLATLLEFDIPSLVPLDGTVSISSLASQSGLSEDKLTRFIRYAVNNFIFQEQEPGIISHSAASAALARDPEFGQFLKWVMVNIAPIEVSIPAACRRWPQSEYIQECALNEVLGSKETFFGWVSKDAERQARFNRAMAGFSGDGEGTSGRSQNFDVDAFPWSQKLGTNAKVVDVGGGSGHVSRALARANPGFSITVEDCADACATGRQMSKNLGNVDFLVHDFFKAQPIHGADAYFFRHILHDWPHAEAVSIVRALVPALKKGARVLVSEFLMPGFERGASSIEDKLVRQMDLQMMGVYNAKERTAEDFAALFQLADERLKFHAKYQLPGDQKSCIFEAIWEGP